MSAREMVIEKEVTQWPKVLYEDVGRVSGLVPSAIADIFLEKCVPSTASSRYREFASGSAVLIVQLNGMLSPSHILEIRQPRRGSSLSSAYFELALYSRETSMPETVARLRKALDNNIRGPHEEVTWVYNDGGHIDEVVFPLKKYKPIMPEVYPFIKPDVNTWVDKFIASDSNVLIFNGPMGTGKSSLIAHIINRGQFSAMTAFDDKVMKNDSLYTNFISWSQNLMVLEDADLLLLGRVDKDNDTMSKLLNVSEGIIDTHGKKIIFTANLGNVRDIDAALLRPGRCFDIVEFRELTMDEANVARTKLGKRLFTNEKKTYSLAQVYQTE
jgi:hypothetical protein